MDIGFRSWVLLKVNLVGTYRKSSRKIQNPIKKKMTLENPHWLYIDNIYIYI